VKTAINFNDHKNRLGTYTLAELTLLDPYFMRTLDRRHLANGLAEILKMSLVKDARLFSLLERHGRALLDQKFQTTSPKAEPNIGSEVMRLAIQSMLEELQPNLWEAELERLPDYGHTFSPAIEMRALPGLLHGEAVNIDMALSTFMAWRRGMLSPHDRDRVFRTMSEVELPIWHQVLTPGLLIKALAEAVRHRDGRQRLPLPVGIGNASFVNDVTDQEIATAVKDLDEYAAALPRSADASRS
jgi:3-dehydroquinate synthase